jgi:hypothetical protein
VGDELVTRFAHLVGVPLAGEGEGALYGVAVDRRARLVLVLADHGKKVAKKPALLGGELDAQARLRGRRAGFDRRPDLGVAGAVSRGPAAVPLGMLGRPPLGLGGWCALYGCLRLARYFLPSSKRAL